MQVEIPILENLYFDVDEFLRKIKEVRIKMSKFDEETLHLLIEFDEDRYHNLLLEDGMIQILCKLVSKNVITIEQALDECGLTEKKFRENAEIYGIEIEKKGVVTK